MLLFLYDYEKTVTQDCRASLAMTTTPSIQVEMFKSELSSVLEQGHFYSDL